MPRNYLLIFQNNAEARSTGGLPGAATILNATDGKITIPKAAQAPGFGELDKPVLPLTKEENKIFFDQLGTYFQDANFTPDFPRTADLMAARWKLETGTGPRRGGLGRPGGDGLPARGDRPGHRRRRHAHR